MSMFLPSVLWRCWLGGRKGIRPVKKTEWWGTGMVICLEWDADLHMAQLMPLPLTVSCFSKIQIGFTFLVPAHPGSPGKRAVVCVCVCVCVFFSYVYVDWKFAGHVCSRNSKALILMSICVSHFCNINAVVRVPVYVPRKLRGGSVKSECMQLTFKPCCPRVDRHGTQFTKYLMTVLWLSCNNANVTISLHGHLIY